MSRRRENVLPVAVLLAAALGCALLPAATAAAEERVGNEVSGSVITPGVGTTVIKMVTADGVELQAFPEMSGAFTFRDVPPGSHMLQAFCIGYYFPEVRVDVSARAGVVRALIVGAGQKAVALNLPMVMKPMGDIKYYELRKPVDIWSILKSPYGLMMVASVFIIFVMPKLKVDPEEYKEMQAQIKGGSNNGGQTSGGQRAIAGR